MKSTRKILPILLIPLILVLLSSCLWDGGGTWNGTSHNAPSYYATATRSAEIFHAQLTAVKQATSDAQWNARQATRQAPTEGEP